MKHPYTAGDIIDLNGVPTRISATTTAEWYHGPVDETLGTRRGAGFMGHIIRHNESPNWHIALTADDRRYLHPAEHFWSKQIFRPLFTATAQESVEGLVLYGHGHFLEDVSIELFCGDVCYEMPTMTRFVDNMDMDDFRAYVSEIVKTLPPMNGDRNLIGRNLDGWVTGGEFLPDQHSATLAKLAGKVVFNIRHGIVIDQST